MKCGYLFVAPRDWDFCNPAVYRAKVGLCNIQIDLNCEFNGCLLKSQRWQRRWFVLWTDDQLTWSIDDQVFVINNET